MVLSKTGYQPHNHHQQHQQHQQNRQQTLHTVNKKKYSLFLASTHELTSQTKKQLPTTKKYLIVGQHQKKPILTVV